MRRIVEGAGGCYLETYWEMLRTVKRRRVRDRAGAMDRRLLKVSTKVLRERDYGCIAM